MEITTMGKVLVTARLANLGDWLDVERKKLEPEKIRYVEVPDALVDTGATLLSLPKYLIEKLGLTPFRTQRVRTAAGVAQSNIYAAVRLTVQGRECSQDVAELPDDCPVLIGQIPLEALDFVVDPQGQRLIGNPDHKGEHMIDMF